MNEIDVLKQIKQRAKSMSKKDMKYSYMQCLDFICQADLGFRHFHEARKIAARNPEHIATRLRQNLKKSGRLSEKLASRAGLEMGPVAGILELYMSACHDVYFEA